MAGVEGLMDLPHEVLMDIVDKCDYQSLKEVALTGNTVLKEIIQRKLRIEAKAARAELGQDATQPYNDQELMERVYHLNSYKNGNPVGIIISKDRWEKGNNSIIDKKNRVEWYVNRKLHRVDDPALIFYYENGRKAEENWYNDGKLHRVDEPAILYYNKDGRKKHEFWYNNEKLHRVGEPAGIRYYKDGRKQEELWYIDGKQHRVDGPAGIKYYEDGQKQQEQWYNNGKLHRIGGPAVIVWERNGRKRGERWYNNGKMI